MEANIINPDQTASKGAVWFHNTHIIYTISVGYQSTKADKRVNDNCHELQERVNESLAVIPIESMDNTHTLLIGLEEQIFEREILNKILPISLNTCFGCSTEPSL